MPRFLAWETGWIMMMPFTKKKKEQQVWGEAWEEGEFSFGHVVFKKPIRLLREEVELGIWIFKSESHERSGWRNTCEADSPQLMFGSRWECTGRVYKRANEDTSSGIAWGRESSKETDWVAREVGGDWQWSVLEARGKEHLKRRERLVVYSTAKRSGKLSSERFPWT